MEENNRKIIKEMCELAIFRAGEGGDYLDYESLYSIIFDRIKEFPEDERITLSHSEICREIRNAKDNFCDFYILRAPDEDGFDFKA